MNVSIEAFDLDETGLDDDGDGNDDDGMNGDENGEGSEEEPVGELGIEYAGGFGFQSGSIICFLPIYKILSVFNHLFNRSFVHSHLRT